MTFPPTSSSPAGTPSPAPPPAPPSLMQRVRRFPATFGLIGFTLLVFAGQLVGQYAFGADVVLYYGAKINDRLAAGEVWRLITPIFVHANLLHVGVNMYSLYAIGPAVERFFGRGRFLTVYLLAGISGVLLSVVMSSSASVGASGAIFGLLGALAMFLFLHRPIFGQMGAAQLRQLLFVALLNLALGLSPGIDNWGHVGGLVAGAVLAWYVGPRYQTSLTMDGRPRLVDQRSRRAVVVRVILSLIAIQALAILAMMNAKGV